MAVRFEMRSPPGVNEKGKEHAPVPYVIIDGPGGSKDVVVRRATDADKQQYTEEFRDFDRSDKTTGRKETGVGGGWRSEDRVTMQNRPYPPPPPGEGAPIPAGPPMTEEAQRDLDMTRNSGTHIQAAHQERSAQRQALAEADKANQEDARLMARQPGAESSPNVQFKEGQDSSMGGVASNEPQQLRGGSQAPSTDADNGPENGRTRQPDMAQPSPDTSPDAQNLREGKSPKKR